MFLGALFGSAGGIPPIGVIGSGLVEAGSSGFDALPIGLDSAPVEPIIGFEGSFGFGGSFGFESGGGMSPIMGIGFSSAGFARSASGEGPVFPVPGPFCSSIFS